MALVCLPGCCRRGGCELSLLFTLAWHLPERRWGGALVGQGYARVFANATAVSDFAARLPHMQNALSWATDLQALYFNNSFPEWLQDALVNSAATFGKTAMWLSDGRWRQFESYSCPQIENPHIHAPRVLAYLHLLPRLERSEVMLFLDAQVPAPHSPSPSPSPSSSP